MANFVLTNFADLLILYSNLLLIEMEIRFNSIQNGWAQLQIVSEAVKYDIIASDALDDTFLALLNVTIRLRRGEKEVFVEFWEEPASSLWRLEQSENGKKLDVHLYFSKQSDPTPFITKKHLIENNFLHINSIETTLDNFTDQVIDLFERLYAFYGPDEYKNNWYPFPEDSLNLLKNLRQYTEKQKPELYQKKMTSPNDITIEDIVDGSLDSEIFPMLLQNNILTLRAKLPYFGQFYSQVGDVADEINVELKIQSEYFHICAVEQFPVNAHFQLHNIYGILQFNNWFYYVPSPYKNVFMHEVQEGYGLAYGQHRETFPWIFSIISDKHICDVLISNINKDIEFTVIDNLYETP